MIWSARTFARDLRKKGVGLVAVMSAVSVLSLFTGAILLTTVKTLGAVADGEYTDRARYAAYSGIQSALEQLNNPRDGTHRGPGWSHAYDDGSPCPATIDEAREDVLQIVFPGRDDVQALVVVYNNSDFVPNPTYKSALAPDGSVIPPGSIYISATGLVAGKKKIQLTSVGSLLSASGYRFEEALRSNGALHVGSGVIDNFDSSATTGATTPVATTADATTYGAMDFWYRPYINQADQSAKTMKSPIGSNSDADGSVVLGDQGTTLVDGEVTTGTGATAAALYKNDANTVITGSTTNHKITKIAKTFAPSAASGYTNLAPPPGPPAPYAPPSAWTLAAGTTYFVDGDLLLDGTQVSVTPGTTAATANAPATIYVKHALTIQNSASLNWGKNPKNLQIYVLDDNAGAVGVRDSKGSFVMAAGGSVVTLDNAEIFGAVQGQEIASQNSRVHFDVTLEGLPVGRADLTNSNTFSDTQNTSPTVTGVVNSGALPPAAGPGPAPAPAPGPGPAPAPGPGPAPAPAPAAGCGCGCGGCLMARTSCV